MPDTRTAWQRRMGVRERQPQPIHDPAATRVTPVIADDGALRGHEVGKQREHMSGRVDAKVTGGEIHINPHIRFATPKELR